MAIKHLPSIHDVAARAGVSIATVSRVLNRSKPVNDDTRRRVEDAVAALGYRTNLAGRSLAQSRSPLVLVLVPDLDNPFFAEVVHGAEEVVRSRGYRIVVIGSNDPAAPHATAVELLMHRLVDGVFSMVHLPDDPAVTAEVDALPWVNCSEFTPGSTLPHVSIDHRQAAVDAVQYLVNRGHRRIGFIGADETYRWAALRSQGYRQALERAGIEFDPGLVQRAAGTGYAEGMAAAGGLLAQRKPPSAVFCVSDTLAIGAIKAFRRAGRRVPEDIAVMGFDDLPLAAIFEPALTTIAQPSRGLGAAAARALLARLDGEAPGPVVLPHQLVVRESA